MIDLEELLRTVLLQPDEPLHPRTTLATAAWTSGLRRRHLRRGGAITTVVGVLAFLVVLVVRVHGRTPATLTPVTLTAPAAGPASAKVPACRLLPRGTLCPDKELAALTLPNPYPGFPHRLDWGVVVSGEGTGRPDALSRLLQIDNVPPVGGHIHATGSFLTLEISRAGAFPTTADGSGRIEGYRVIRTYTVLGCPATLVQVGKSESELLLTVHGFAINVSGELGPGHVATHHDVPTQQLIDVVDAIKHLPAG